MAAYPDRSPKPIDGPKRPTTTTYSFFGNKFSALYCLWRTYITSKYIAIILKPMYTVQPIHNVHIISLMEGGGMVKVKGAESSQAGRDLTHSLSVCPCVFERMRGRPPPLNVGCCCLLVLMIINESLALLRFRLFLEWGAILVSFHLSLFSSSSSSPIIIIIIIIWFLSPCIEDESSLVNCVMSLKWEYTKVELLFH